MASFQTNLINVKKIPDGSHDDAVVGEPKKKLLSQESLAEAMASFQKNFINAKQVPVAKQDDEDDDDDDDRKPKKVSPFFFAK